VAIDVAGVYARALVELADEGGVLDDVQAAASAFAEAFDRDPDVRATILNPGIERRRKCSMLEAALGASVPPLFVDFLGVVMRKGRESDLRAILGRVDDYVLAAKGIVRAEMVTATPADATARSSVEKVLGERLGARVLLTDRADPAIVGGMMLRYRGRVVDGSVRERLRRLHAHLLEERVGSESFDENQS
jgi:F-type H+-transporting ATPase subunit delta